MCYLILVVEFSIAYYHFEYCKTLSMELGQASLADVIKAMISSVVSYPYKQGASEGISDLYLLQKRNS